MNSSDFPLSPVLLLVPAKHDLVHRYHSLALPLHPHDDKAVYLTPLRLPAPRLLLLGIGIFWIASLVQGIWKNYQRSLKFKAFASLNKCGEPRVVPQPPFAKFRHKLRLFTYRGGDLLDGLFTEKYRNNGATHVLCDRFGTPRVIHNVNPANLNAVLSTSYNDWRPSQIRANVAYPIAQRGLLMTEGNEWLRNHKAAVRSMAGLSQKDTNQDHHSIDSLFDYIGDDVGDGWTKTVDVLDLFHRLALDMSTTYILGTDAGAVAALTDEASAGKWAYQEASEVIRVQMALRARLGSWCWIADSFKYRKAVATVVEFVDDLISKACADLKTSQDQGDERTGQGVIKRLIRNVDLDTVKHVTLDLLLAGQNMTGVLAAFVLAHLESRQDIYNRMRDEVIQMFGTEAQPKAPLTWANMRACTTMQHVILETARMYPLLINISRNAKQDTMLPRGGGPDGSQPLAVPEGATIVTNLYVMQRREEEWGSDSKEFNPDRWIGRKFGPEFSPFGGGPRVCIGQQLTMTQVSLLLTRLCLRFSAISAPEGSAKNLVKGYKVTIAPKNGVKLRFLRAET